MIIIKLVFQISRWRRYIFQHKFFIVHIIEIKNTIVSMPLNRMNDENRNIDKSINHNICHHQRYIFPRLLCEITFSNIKILSNQFCRNNRYKGNRFH